MYCNKLRFQPIRIDFVPTSNFLLSFSELSDDMVRRSSVGIGSLNGAHGALSTSIWYGSIIVLHRKFGDKIYDDYDRLRRLPVDCGLWTAGGVLPSPVFRGQTTCTRGVFPCWNAGILVISNAPCHAVSYGRHG